MCRLDGAAAGQEAAIHAHDLLQAVDGALRTRMRYVLKKGPEGWKIVAGQNTDVKPPPAPKGAPAGKPEPQKKP